MSTSSSRLTSTRCVRSSMPRRGGNSMATILFPLPDRDFDVTEVAVPWKLLREAGHEPVFATEAGATPACDPLLITGVVFGKLGAAPEPIAFYRELEQAPEFVSPRKWSE